jgi:GDPmannose 4,6-dehydratase
LHLHYGDATDESSLRSVLQKIKPNEIYHLAAQSHVRVSFDQPVYTADVVALGTIRLLEAVRDLDDSVRVYQASSSEMFGSAPAPQDESTVFHPRSPYACAKVYAYHQMVNYREAYGLFAVNGILFNHESPRRGETFVTRKITRAATRIKMGLQDKLYLGNLDAKRDWGFAGDYVHAMWLMLQADEPDDYVIATGKSYSVRDFCEFTFGNLDMDYRDHVAIDGRYLRPTEVNHLEGDSSKAKEKLGWMPEVDLKQLIKMMVEADLKHAEREHFLASGGHAVRDSG